MKTIVIFDFDWTLINENSDTYIIEKLNPEIYKQMEKIRVQNKFGWTKLMDHMMGLLWENSIKPDELKKCLSGIILDPAMIKSLEFLNSKGDDVEVHIVSDANTYFIETILESNNITHLFKSITTNGAHFDDNGRLHVTPYHSHPEPHNCKFCPTNLCKGDGAGDFCPLQHIKNGHVLARKGWALNKLIDKNANHTKAKIHLWDNASDVFNILHKII